MATIILFDIISFFFFFKLCQKKNDLEIERISIFDIHPSVLIYNKLQLSAYSLTKLLRTPLSSVLPNPITRSSSFFIFTLKAHFLVITENKKKN